MPDFTDVVRVAGGWPEVTEALSYGTPSLKVRNTSFSRLWGDRDFAKADVTNTEVLVVFCDLTDKDALIATGDGALFDAPHYLGYPAVLVALATVRQEALTSLLAYSYRLRAPAQLRRQFDEGRPLD